jgi:hypothetical protein
VPSIFFYYLDGSEALHFDKGSALNAIGDLKRATSARIDR